MKKEKLQGLVAATLSPLDEKGNIKPNLIDRLIDRYVLHQVNGIYICGSTGEGISLSTKKRKELAEAYTKAAAGRLKVIVHVGHHSIEEAVDLAGHAQSIGADAISATAPSYFDINSEFQLAKALQPMTEKAPDLPFYYYHIPSKTNIDVSMVRFLEISGELLPSMAGIKYTSLKLDELQTCINRFNTKYQILYGFDELYLYGLVAGSEAMVGSTYNLMAPLYHKIRESYLKGELERANQYQQEAIDIINVIISYPLIPSLRYCMKLIGFDCGPALLPHTSLTKAEGNELKSRLEETTFFQWSLIKECVTQYSK